MWQKDDDDGVVDNGDNNDDDGDDYGDDNGDDDGEDDDNVVCLGDLQILLSLTC